MSDKLAQTPLRNPIPFELRAEVKAILMHRSTPDYLKKALGQWLRRSMTVAS